MRHQLTEPAERDVRDILRDTLRMFGPRQLRAYASIISRGIELVCDNPERAGSSGRDDLAPGLRSFHLEIAAGRRGGAAHCIYYLRGRLADGTDGIVIVRVLHEHMEPRHRLVRTLKDFRHGEPGPSE